MAQMTKFVKERRERGSVYVCVCVHSACSGNRLFGRLVAFPAREAGPGAGGGMGQSCATYHGTCLKLVPVIEYTPCSVVMRSHHPHSLPPIFGLSPGIQCCPWRFWDPLTSSSCTTKPRWWRSLYAAWQFSPPRCFSGSTFTLH